MSNEDPYNTFPIPVRSLDRQNHPWYTRWWMIVAYSLAGTLLVLCFVGAIVGGSDDEPAPGAESPSAVSETTETPEPTTEAATPTPEATTSAAVETTEAEPEPEPEPEPTTTKSSGGGGGSDDDSSVYYKNCDAARAAGAAPVHKGDPGYGSHLDRDGDGIGCESSSGGGSGGGSGGDSGGGSGGGGGGDDSSVYYKNCDAARAAGAAPVHRGDPGYGSHLDRDGDGVGCE